MSNIRNTSYKVIIDKIDNANHNDISIENGSLHYIADGANKGLWFHLDDAANRIILDSSYVHGWASYNDTVWTEGSPFSILAGNTAVLDNNANIKLDSQLPVGVSSFYDEVNNKITPELEGDAYNISIRFKAKTSSNSDKFDISLDVGGSLGIIISETKTFPKGLDIEQSFNTNFTAYALSTFIENGGQIKIGGSTGNLSIYDIVYVIVRTHKGV